MNMASPVIPSPVIRGERAIVVRRPLASLHALG